MIYRPSPLAPAIPHCVCRRASLAHTPRRPSKPARASSRALRRRLLRRLVGAAQVLAACRHPLVDTRQLLHQQRRPLLRRRLLLQRQRQRQKLLWWMRLRWMHRQSRILPLQGQQRPPIMMRPPPLIPARPLNEPPSLPIYAFYLCLIESLHIRRYSCHLRLTNTTAPRHQRPGSLQLASGCAQAQKEAIATVTCEKGSSRFHEPKRAATQATKQFLSAAASDLPPAFTESR